MKYFRSDEVLPGPRQLKYGVALATPPPVGRMSRRAYAMEN